MLLFFFFFNDTATTEIYTLSLHDALPISCCSSGVLSSPSGCAPGARFRIGSCRSSRRSRGIRCGNTCSRPSSGALPRSEEHTSELQSRLHLVCRLLLEKKKKRKITHSPSL